MVRSLGLAEAIDRELRVFKRHFPYHASDHVLNLPYNVMVGGTCIEDLKLLRTNLGYLDALGAERIPDPTTAGDFIAAQEPHLLMSTGLNCTIRLGGRFNFKNGKVEPLQCYLRPERIGIRGASAAAPALAAAACCATMASFAEKSSGALLERSAKRPAASS